VPPSPEGTEVNLFSPRSLLGSRRERKGPTEHATETIALASYQANTGSFPRDAKGSGKEREGNVSRNARSPRTVADGAS
jgi:hypothetical protein